MPLRKWMSYDLQVIEVLKDSKTQHTYTDFRNLGSTNVLGVGWNPQTDTFEYKVSSLVHLLEDGE